MLQGQAVHYVSGREIYEDTKTGEYSQHEKTRNEYIFF
jgi:hypothetical protein